MAALRRTQIPLSKTHPDLVKEWDYEKNAPLMPDQVSAGSNKKVWWKCSKGHEWQTIINDRGTKHVGCPYCANRKVLVGFNDLGTLRPDIAKEWDYEKNGDLRPENCTVGCRKKVWWKCSYGHIWCAQVTDRSRGVGCPVCSNHKVLSGHNDLATIAPDLAKEWDYEKNKGLKDKAGRDISTPDKVTIFSSQSVWWRCNRGHEWKTAISSRSSGHECPRCQHIGSSKAEQGIVYYLSKCCEVEPRAVVDQQEIDVYLPEHRIGIEYDGKHWHRNKQYLESNKNNVLKSIGISLFRVKESDHNCIDGNIIYYKYDDMGANYEWALKALFGIISDLIGNEQIEKIEIDVKRDSLKIREQFSLLAKKNCIAVKCPEIAKEWNYKKNGVLTPEMFFPGSSEKVWWIGKCGHEWQAIIDNRVRGTGCPYCLGKGTLKGFNDLATSDPVLAKQWHPTKNPGITPEDVRSGSEKKIWWLGECGHEWQATVYARSKGNNCPYCSNRKLLSGFNDLLTVNNLLASEWNYKKNEPLKPSEVMYESNKKVWWMCSKGHEWQAKISARSRGSGCPYCSEKAPKAVRCIETGVVYESFSEAAKKSGCRSSNISLCCKGKQKTAGGYHWEYK